MGRILETVERFLKKDDWPYNLLDDRPIYKTGFEGKNGQFTCYAQERAEQDQFVFYSVFPVRAPEERRSEVAEFITRANYGMIIGNFELDYADGEIRYKTSVDVEGSELTPELIKPVAFANLGTLDHYWPALAAVAAGQAAPQEALALVGA